MSQETAGNKGRGRQISLAGQNNHGFIRKIAEWYFKPKSFERNGKLYESIGIRQFKKAYDYAGKIILYPINKCVVGVGGFEKPDWPNNYWLWDKSIYGLRKFGIATRISEAYHLFFEAVFAAYMTNNFSEGDTIEAIISGGLLFANTYLIMLQRYNRARLDSTIGKLEERITSRTTDFQ